MGMGDMMQQMMDGTNPAAAAQAAGTGTPSSAASSAGSNMPPAEELHSDNLTQMVQNHLKALGYDTGDTDGELSLETIDCDLPVPGGKGSGSYRRS